MAQQGNLIVLSGPSGTGKGTICKALLRSNPNLQYSISATTRSPRKGEQHGVNYWFFSKERFQEMIENDELLEWAEVYGNYYGTPWTYVAEILEKGQDIVLEIDTQGALKVKDKFPQGIFIFIVPPSLDELADRLWKRGTDSPEVIHTRLQCVREELKMAPNYHYLVINDRVSDAVNKIAAIILAEKCRMERNAQIIDNISSRGTVE
ncbi:MAG: gmk 2 [Firmicutes bacterium]|nr:gmk 2 [Bacillota bacterium]